MAIIPSRLYNAPGVSVRRAAYEMLEFGRQMRDIHLRELPIIWGATHTFQTLAANREFKISGTPRGAPKAMEYIQNARTRCYDGTLEFGLEQFEKRRAMDYAVVGKTMFKWDEQYIDYLDPVEMYFNLQERRYEDRVTHEHWSVDRVVANYPIPIGGHGYFVAPVFNAVKMGMLHWLINEHDMAAADGRKIRDIILVMGDELSTQIQEAMEDTLKLWSGADPTQVGVQIVYSKDTVVKSASDLVARLSLANIPENFNRETAIVTYVNEISNALGLAMRHFWNDERGTNRALEDVQEARQVNKGPGAFVRTEQSLFNASGCLKQFGASTKFHYIEEVDSATRKVNAEIIKMYSEALASFAKVFGGNVNGEGLLAWLISEDILPADIDLITDIGTIAQSGTEPVPGEGTTIERSNQPTIGITSQNGSENKKSFDEIDYGEITIDSNGRIVDRRSKVFRIENVIATQLVKAKSMADRIAEDIKEPSFSEALMASRQKNFDLFCENRAGMMRTKDSDLKRMVGEIPSSFEEMKTQDHHAVYEIIKRNKLVEAKEKVVA